MRYALRRTEGRSEREAILAARRSWTSRFGEYQTDPSMRRVFGAFEPPFEEVPTLGPPFEQLALEVFAPLLAVKEEEL
jgi:hypothetical protein